MIERKGGREGEGKRERGDRWGKRESEERDWERERGEREGEKGRHDLGLGGIVQVFGGVEYWRNHTWVDLKR